MKKEVELIQKRKPREKHFLQENGIIRAEIYDSDIHYYNNGKFEEIDNTLEEKKEYYTNKRNDFIQSIRDSANKWNGQRQRYGAGEEAALLDPADLSFL